MDGQYGYFNQNYDYDMNFTQGGKLKGKGKKGGKLGKGKARPT